MGAGAVAVIIAKEKHIVEEFQRARAVSAGSAVTLLAAVAVWMQRR